MNVLYKLSRVIFGAAGGRPARRPRPRRPVLEGLEGRALLSAVPPAGVAPPPGPEVPAVIEPPESVAAIEQRDQIEVEIDPERPAEDPEPSPVVVAGGAGTPQG